MLKTRVIPVLLLKNKGLVKSRQFKNETYLGDPINAVRIFNDKEVDELIFLDTMASKVKRPPDFDLIGQIATECFMPFAYGGGIMDMETSKRLLAIGVEKLIVNTLAFLSLDTVKKMVESFGSQSVIGSIDIKKNMWGKYQVYSHANCDVLEKDPVTWAQKLVEAGVGEIMLNAVDRDGMMNGYDNDLIKKVTASVPVPVIACGGACNLEDFVNATKSAGASAVAAGSMFVFHGKHRAVLINFPNRELLEKILE